MYALGAAAGTCLLLFVFAFLGTRILRSILAGLLRAILGVRVEIGSLYLCCGMVQATNIKVHNPEGYSDQHAAITVSRLHLHFDLFSPLRSCGQVTSISEVELSNLNIVVEHKGLKSNLQVLLDHLQACQPAALKELADRAGKLADQAQAAQAEAQRMLGSTQEEAGRRVDLHAVRMTGLEAAVLVKGHLATLALGDIYIEDFAEKHGIVSLASAINILLQTLLRTVSRNLPGTGLVGVLKQSRRCCGPQP